jgi:hypothetical protein
MTNSRGVRWAGNVAWIQGMKTSNNIDNQLDATITVY